MRKTDTLAGWMWAMLVKAAIALLVVKPLAERIAWQFMWIAYALHRAGRLLR